MKDREQHKQSRRLFLTAADDCTTLIPFSQSSFSPPPLRIEDSESLDDCIWPCVMGNLAPSSVLVSKRRLSMLESGKNAISLSVKYTTSVEADFVTPFSNSFTAKPVMRDQ
jgi:hypothetical protein